MSPALANDGALSFVVLLALLLAMMLVAVIRLPRWDGSSSEEDARPQRATAAPSRPADVQVRAEAAIARAAAVLPARRPPGPEPGDAATMPLPAIAAGQRGPGCYAARHVTGGTIPRPEVSGGPPWAPVPRPPGIK